MSRSSNRLFTLSWAALLSLGIGASFGQAAPATQTSVRVQAFPELLPPEAASQRPTPVPAAAELARTLTETDGVFDLSPLTQEEIDAADQRSAAQDGHVKPGPLRVGMVRPIEPQALRMPDDWTFTQPLDDGRTVWLLGIRSPAALEIRVHLTQVDLGDGSLLVYSLTDAGPVVRGPYRGRGPDGDGDFWPASLPGEVAFLEYTGDQPPQLEIAEIVHSDRDASGWGNPEDDDGTRGGPLECNLDVMCFSVNLAARAAVGRMRYIRDGNLKSCTGTLLADLDSQTYVPYFLTANHCVDETIDLDTLEVFWRFEETPCWGGGCPADSCVNDTPSMDGPSNVGATLLATSGAINGNDASVLRLHGSLPPSVGFAGWSSNNDDEELGVYGIHHPAGSWKRIVYGHYVSTSIDCGIDCGCFTPINYAFYKIDDGITEPGSSGSAMFTSDGRIIGQLFGSCSLCPDDFLCVNQADYCMQYGEFAETYPDVDYWLELGGTIHVDDSNTTSPWDGTSANPYRTVAQGQAALWDADGLRMVIDDGNYPETPTLNRRVRVTAAGGLARIGDLP